MSTQKKRRNRSRKTPVQSTTDHPSPNEKEEEEEEDETETFMDAREYQPDDINAVMNLNHIEENFAQHNVSSINRVTLVMRTLDQSEINLCMKPIYLTLYFKSKHDPKLEMSREFRGHYIKEIIAEVNEFIKKEIKI